jgi:HlyD family secretion protein
MDINKIKEKLKDFYQARKRLVWIGAVVLVVATILLVVFIPRKNAIEDNVQYVQVSRGSLTESIGEVGYVEAQPSAALEWQSAGIVASYEIKVGDQVSKDDVLMELEFSSWPNASLEAQSELLTAELELENMISSDSELQTALQNAIDAEWTVWDKKQMRDFWISFGNSSDYRVDAVRANYIAAVREMWVLEEEYEIIRKTLDEDDPALIEAYDALQAKDLERDSYLRALNQILGHSYDQDVEADFIEYDLAMADLERARAEYNRVLDNSQELSAAQANVQALQNTINEAKIIAPFDGTVTEISYLPGESVESGAMAVQVDDLENLVVSVDVSEIDIAKVAVGQPVVVAFDALPYKEYSGDIKSISSAGTDESGTVEFSVTVAIEDAGADIKPGFTAMVSIITSQAEDVLLVPTQALRGQGGNNMVMVVGDDGIPVPVIVEVGASSDEFTEVLSGELKEGDQLLVVVNMTQDEFGGGGFGAMGGIHRINGGGGRPPQE